jgi:hypothetical protein
VDLLVIVEIEEILDDSSSFDWMPITSHSVYDVYMERCSLGSLFVNHISPSIPSQFALTHNRYESDVNSDSVRVQKFQTGEPP